MNIADLNSIQSLITSHKEMLNFHLKKINDLISNTELKGILKDYQSSKNKQVDYGFNLFMLISDTYYKENFHSDIIFSLLNPKGNHKEGYKFLIEFLKYLQSIRVNINIFDFENAYLERECKIIDGWIDICIKDDYSKKAIIIENKIYNAPDMPRQIPRYYWDIKDGQSSNIKYEVEAVVYLKLNTITEPNKNDWTEEDKAEINNKIKVVKAFDRTDNDLTNGWLLNCEKNANYFDSLCVIKQYRILLTKLGDEIMDMEIMEKFLKQMLKDDNYKIANSISEGLNELVEYRKLKILNIYRNKNLPFDIIKDAKDLGWSEVGVSFERLKIDEIPYDIGVTIDESCYKFQFFRSDYDEKNKSESNFPLQLLKEKKLDEGFNPIKFFMEKKFSFPEQEQELYSFIDKFMDTFSK